MIWINFHELSDQSGEPENFVVLVNGAVSSFVVKPIPQSVVNVSCKWNVKYMFEI
jgi:hypothetical protein